mmetsp:Transcript_62177/g.166846  ORF Transcript_62177/g.166846 Transcript_62177/m.166846 type:complete len:82 (-) Transcript_62177:187-432(-)
MDQMRQHSNFGGMRNQGVACRCPVALIVLNSFPLRRCGGDLSDVDLIKRKNRFCSMQSISEFFEKFLIIDLSSGIRGNHGH